MIVWMIGSAFLCLENKYEHKKYEHNCREYGILALLKCNRDIDGRSGCHGNMEM